MIRECLQAGYSSVCCGHDEASGLGKSRGVGCVKPLVAANAEWLAFDETSNGYCFQFRNVAESGKKDSKVETLVQEEL